MNTKNIISIAVELAGGSSKVASHCGLKSYQAVGKWCQRGRLPRTEWTGETNYAATIEAMIIESHGSDRGCTRDALLGVVPVPAKYRDKKE